jgi:two-component system, cell cycle response regulator
METLVTGPAAPISSQNRDACLVHIYPAGASMGARHKLGDSAKEIGREADCDICANDNSVSRHHARIQLGADGYYAIDLKSTNGTFVNDAPIQSARLKDGDYLRVGNCIFRFLVGGNVEADYHEVIYRLTITDALTDTHNKRSLMEFLDRELVRAERHNRPLSSGRGLRAARDGRPDQAERAAR